MPVESTSVGKSEHRGLGPHPRFEEEEMVHRQLSLSRKGYPTTPGRLLVP